MDSQSQSVLLGKQLDFASRQQCQMTHWQDFPVWQQLTMQ